MVSVIDWTGPKWEVARPSPRPLREANRSQRQIGTLAAGTGNATGGCPHAQIPPAPASSPPLRNKFELPFFFFLTAISVLPSPGICQWDCPWRGGVPCHAALSLSGVFLFLSFRVLMASSPMQLPGSLVILGVVEFPIDVRRLSHQGALFLILLLDIPCLVERRSAGKPCHTHRAANRLGIGESTILFV